MTDHTGHPDPESTVDGLREAAEVVLDWADHYNPWPGWSFENLYTATGRRTPRDKEPVGPRYYGVGGPTTPDGCSHPEGSMTSTIDGDLIVCARCGRQWSNRLDAPDPESTVDGLRLDVESRLSGDPATDDLPGFGPIPERPEHDRPPAVGWDARDDFDTSGSIPERPAEPLREALMGAVRQWELDANGATLIAAKNLRRCAADVRTALALQSTPESRDE